MNLTKYFNFIVILIVFSLGICAGRYLFPQYKDKIIKQDPKIVYVKGESTTNTIVHYVPKENGENTDVEINIPKTQIDVLVNGKPFTFKPLFGEQYNFENGKLVLNQSSKLDLDIKIPPAYRPIELGGYVDNQGFGGTLVLPKKSNGSNIIMIGPSFDLKSWNLRYSLTL
jgi:hypothetical protein